MIFNTVAYFLLFLVPAAIVFRLVRPSAQPWVCAVFGAAFFIFFSLTQIGGVAGAACLLIFLWESVFSRFYKQGSIICLIGIAQTLLFLIIFKYWNFFTGLIFGASESNPVFWSGLFLPLGISFFTFEFIHYAVDRYRGKTPAGKFSEYLAFILFFPTMVAGPIKRYQDFLPKLVSPSRSWQGDWEQGITRILAGLAKKFVVADLLTAFTNHLNRADIAQAERWVLPIWLLAYGMKIYFDFSAYSDIAIGSARLFGIRVPENFDWPYLRVNIAEFWKHWHMSLYRWLVDYVFIPLGGSRTTQSRVCLNIMITMFLSGLWHGAGLNFIVWGLWHGALLAIHRLWTSWREGNLTVLPRIQTALASAPIGLIPVGVKASEPYRLAPIGLVVRSLSAARRRGAALLSEGFGSAKLAAPSPAWPAQAAEATRLEQTASAAAILANDQNPPPTLIQTRKASVAGKIAGWALTFVMVNLGWAFFCMDLPTSLFFLRRLFFG